MSNRQRSAALLVAAATVVGCSAAGNGAGLSLGRDGSGGAAVGTGGSPSLSVVGDASSNALSAHIEQNHVTVEFVTVSCAGDCADVEAVAVGGVSPYAYSWEDGSTNPTRRVCPSRTTSYEVTVRDAGVQFGEFVRDPEVARAPLTAEVRKCHGGADAGTDAGSSILCVQNPSFEGTVTASPLDPFDAPPWKSCTGAGIDTAAIGDPTSYIAGQGPPYPKASDGLTYLLLGQDSGFGGRSLASQTLCEPIPKGASRSFLVDLARGATDNPSLEAKVGTVQVWGGADCAESELLWTSPPLTPNFATYCVTLKPTENTTNIGFRPLGDGGAVFAAMVEALVDHIVPVLRCP